ncbi:hypothetical protein LINGRAHAP2_LOCUS25757 [Linum grandiflorum]
MGRTSMLWAADPEQQLLGVFHGGAIHWCTTELVTLGTVVQALDLASETFHKLALPRNLHREGKGYFKVNIGVVDSCFCSCVLYDKEGKTDIWVMKEYGRFDSWSKLYTVQLDSVAGSVMPLGSSVGGRILFMFGRYRFVWCDRGSTLSIVEAFKADGDETYEAVYCVESLVKLFQLQEVDDDDVEVKRKEHEAKLGLRDRDTLSNDDSCLHMLSMIQDMDLSLMNYLLATAIDEEDLG